MFCKLIEYGYRRSGSVREDVMFYGPFKEMAEEINSQTGRWKGGWDFGFRHTKFEAMMG